MDAEKLHKMLKPLPNDFDEFIKNNFQGAWTGYVGMYCPEPQFMEDTYPEKCFIVLTAKHICRQILN